MANNTINYEEAITKVVNDLSKREVLFSYANTFDKISKDVGDSITALAHNKKELAALDERVAKIIQSSFAKPEKILEEFTKARAGKRLEIIETMLKEPEKLGKVSPCNTLDMLNTQKIAMDYRFQVARRVENTKANRTAKGEIKRHAEHVWETAQKFSRDNEYNEFVRAKTAAEKLETRLVKGYLADQESLAGLVAKAPASALAALKEKKVEFESKQRPHIAVRTLQDRVQKETVSKAEKQTKKMKM